MRKITKKQWMIIVPALLVVAAALVFWLTRGKKEPEEKKPELTEELFYQDNTAPTTNYSEHSVLYPANRGLLPLIDTASGKDMIYCDRPNCTHQDRSSCPAAFCTGNCNGPVLFNNHLYFIGNLTGENYLQEQYLYEMDANGANRKKVVAFSNVQDVQQALYRDNYLICAYRNHSVFSEEGQIIDDKEEAGILVVNLETYKVQMGEMVPGQLPDVGYIHYEDGSVYYLRTYIDDQCTELEISEAIAGDYENFYRDHLIFELFRYDIADNRQTLLKQIRGTISVAFADGDVYYNAGEGFRVYDHRTGEEQKLLIADNAVAFHKSGDAVYYSYTDVNTKDTVYACLEHGASRDMLRLASPDPMAILRICGESVYVCYMEGGHGCIGVMKLEDIRRGRYKVQKLRGGV